VLVLAGTLAACGDDDGNGQDAADRLDAVSISGDVGEPPKVEWTSRMTAGKPEVETLVKGDGAALKKNDEVFVNFWVGNGYTQKTAFNTFGPKTAASVLTVGAAPAQPQVVEDLITAFLGTEIKPGLTRGTRLAITVGASELFGQNVAAEPVAKADIGKDDSLLVIADVLDTEILTKPDGTTQPAPGWAPKVVLKKGEPTALDFGGTPKLGTKLKVGTLVEGSGDEVEKGDLIVVNYLGAVYQGKQPFDESFSKPEPLTTPIGLQSVIDGWDQGLVGQTVGSRVMLGIPPALGYGKQGSGESIPPSSTLYFVVDILAAA
jgi:peptidylprolyl isomerase